LFRLASRARFFCACSLLGISTTLADDVLEGHAPSLIDLLVGLALGAIAAFVWKLVARMRKAQRAAMDVAHHSELVIETASAIGVDGEQLTLERLAEHACQLLAIDRACVFVKDSESTAHMRITAAAGAVVGLVGERFSASQGSPADVFNTGAPVVVNDYRTFERRIVHELSAEMRASASVPLRWGGKVRGTLSVGTCDPQRRFDRRDVELLVRLAALAEMALEQGRMRAQLEHTVRAGVEALAAAVDARDHYTATHSEDVVGLATAVGRRLGLDAVSLEQVALGARLHDVGKLGVPDAVLNHRGPLTAEQWDLMRLHPISGARIVARVPGLEAIAAIVRSEHERWDGGGYPDGLAAEQIPLASRIILACDAYHAMTSDRPYRKALPADEAIDELVDCAGSQFDPQVIEALTDVLAGPRPERAQSLLAA
jgi:HD-GYP domain-containing protein (c-di-GMP phosphodiesterase class II)